MITLDSIINYASTMYPKQEAVVDGDCRITYAELGERCRRLGSGLLKSGIQPGDRVATLLANSNRYLELHLTVPSIGAMMVPINTRLAVPEIEYILQDSGAKVLIIDSANADRLESLKDSVARVISCDDYEGLIEAGDDVALPGPESEDTLAGLYYTGGTTGPAKGVMLTHRNLVSDNLLLGVSGFLEENISQLYLFPLFHLASIATLYGNTWRGAKQIFIPEIDPAVILETIEKEQVTHLPMVPTIINMLLNHPDIGNTDLSTLRSVTHGAAPIAPDLCRHAVEVFQAEFTQAYGMTEASAVVTLFTNEENWLDHERIRSAGRAMPGIEIVVRRPDGSPCSAGEAGEITLRGPTVMRGYWNKPEETARALRDGWYWSGDVGYLDDEQYLFVVDRAKDMIVSGGENVYSIETEAALMAHEAVLECAVVGIPHESWGEAVHAIVRVKPGMALEEKALIDHCRTLIAGYKCPKSVDFVQEELPKSGVGKILKRELRAPYWEGRERAVN